MMGGDVDAVAVADSVDAAVAVVDAVGVISNVGVDVVVDDVASVDHLPFQRL